MVLSSAKDATVAFLNILLPLLTPIVDVLVMKKELLFLIDQRNMCHCRSHLRSEDAKGIGAGFLAQKYAHTNNKRVMDSISSKIFGRLQNCLLFSIHASMHPN